MPGVRLIRFAGPPPERGMHLSMHRALHKPRLGGALVKCHGYASGVGAREARHRSESVRSCGSKRDCAGLKAPLGWLDLRTD